MSLVSGTEEKSVIFDVRMLHIHSDSILFSKLYVYCYTEQTFILLTTLVTSPN